MELGVLGLDGFQGSENGVGSLSSDGETSKQKWAARSGGFSQEGSGFCGDDWRVSKVARTDGDFSPASNALLLQSSRCLPLKNTSTASAAISSGTSVSSDPNMLSFSSCSKSDTSTLPYIHQMAIAHTKNAGYYSGALSASTGMYLLNGVRGPFTPSQWLELEQQALIYKYITSNEPIPAHLLIPIKRALESAGLFGFNGGTLRPTACGWGPFHFGYANSTDPEPGRCRRTDGKKWRCSRDAVADQKYCERHMNRGRHRSRKHVEGQGNGHSVSGATKSSTTKFMPPSAVASSSSAMVVPGGGSSNSFETTQHYHQAKSLQPLTTSPAINPLLNRMLVNRENCGEGLQDSAQQLSFLSPSGPNINLNCSDSSFSIPKHQSSYEESVPSAFGVPCNGSLLVSTCRKSSSFCSSYGSSAHDLNDREESEPQHSLHTFMDEWPKNQSGGDRSNILWRGLQSQPDRTQLSMSIPMGSADFMSSTSSPTNEKVALSPLRLSRELEMGLGVGSLSQSNRQLGCIPISWEASMGGPLGEVLQSSSNAHSVEGKKTSALNLLPKGWDGMGSYQLSSSSPTGVLQKSALVSLSNSSAGSSPRADNSKTIESGGSLCNDLLGSTNLAHSCSLPASEWNFQ